MTRTARLRSITQSVRPVTSRRLEILDIENLVGVGYIDGNPHDLSPQDVRYVLAQYRGVVGIGPDDQAVVAAGHRFARLLIGANMSGLRLAVAPENDNAADLLLLDAADPDYVSRRFGSLVIGSGDGIFTDLAERLRSRGVPVHLVTGRGAVARSLMRVCTSHTWLSLDRGPAAA